MECRRSRFLDVSIFPDVSHPGGKCAVEIHPDGMAADTFGWNGGGAAPSG